MLADLLPLITLVAAMASGRATALAAAGLALAASLPTLLLHAAPLAPFLAQRVPEGLFLALGPAAIVLGGILFHAAVQPPDDPARQPDSIFATALLLGPFTESVTGFGVGSVFAASALRRAMPGAGAAAPAAAAALLAQCVIPWGGLGPGTLVGATLAGIPPASISARNAIQVAALLPVYLALSWRYAAAAGQRPARETLAEEAGWTAAFAAMLLAASRVVPWEMTGLAATGPLIAARAWLALPHDRATLARAGRAAAPYLALVALLIGGHAWHAAPGVRPFPGLPGLTLAHPAIALLIVAAIAGRGRPLAAARRARRPAATLAAFIVLSRLLSGAGVFTRLAGGIQHAAGPAAPFASPVIAAMSGFFLGSNVASNAAMMPLQAALGTGLDPAALPSVQNAVGAAAMLLSPALVGLVCALTGARPAAIWRLSWPILPAALAMGLVSVWIALP